MPTLKHQLANQLTETIAPLLGAKASTTGQFPKRIAKTLRKLGKQVSKRVQHPSSAALQAPETTGKRGRSAIVSDLTAAVQPYLAVEKAAKTPKKVRKTLRRLAAQVVKQDRKQAKQRAKIAEQPAVVPPPATRSVSAKPKPTAKPSPVAATPTRRRAATQTSSPKTSTPIASTPTEAV